MCSVTPYSTGQYFNEYRDIDISSYNILYCIMDYFPMFFMLKMNAMAVHEAGYDY